MLPLSPPSMPDITVRASIKSFDACYMIHEMIHEKYMYRIGYIVGIEWLFALVDTIRTRLE